MNMSILPKVQKQLISISLKRELTKFLISTSFYLLYLVWEEDPYLNDSIRTIIEEISKTYDIHNFLIDLILYYFLFNLLYITICGLFKLLKRNKPGLFPFSSLILIILLFYITNDGLNMHVFSDYYEVPANFSEREYFFSPLGKMEPDSNEYKNTHWKRKRGTRRYISEEHLIFINDSTIHVKTWVIKVDNLLYLKYLLDISKSRYKYTGFLQNDSIVSIKRSKFPKLLFEPGIAIKYADGKLYIPIYFMRY